MWRLAYCTKTVQLSVLNIIPFPVEKSWHPSHHHYCITLHCSELRLKPHVSSVRKFFLCAVCRQTFSLNRRHRPDRLSETGHHFIFSDKIFRKEPNDSLICLSRQAKAQGSCIEAEVQFNLLTKDYKMYSTAIPSCPLFLYPPPPP